MRYRIGDAPIDGAYAGTSDFVTITVWLTFVIGIGFIVAGIRGRQHWLSIWGGITVLACAIYAVVIQLGLLG